MSLFAATDRSLLLAEWVKIDDIPAFCPVCREGEVAGHEPGCEMDLALAERAFATAVERDRARLLMAFADEDTLPPGPTT